jgi:hypothetical protein
MRAPVIEEEIPEIEFDLNGGELKVLVSYDRASRKFQVPEETLTVSKAQ